MAANNQESQSKNTALADGGFLIVWRSYFQEDLVTDTAGGIFMQTL